MSDIFEDTYESVKTLPESVKVLQKSINYIGSFVKKLRQTEENRLSVCCVELNGKNTFVKIKGDYFSIEKVLFSFVEFNDNNKRLANIDVCMKFWEWQAFAKDILSGRIFKLAADEKAKGEKFPKAVYFGPMGGVDENKCRERNLRTDGKAISRRFSLSPGNKVPYILTAEQRPGKTNQQGLIVPENGKPEVVIRVPVTREMLIGACEQVNAHITAYLSSMYVDKTSSFYYTPKKNNSNNN